MYVRTYVGLPVGSRRARWFIGRVLFHAGLELGVATLLRTRGSYILALIIRPIV